MQRRKLRGDKLSGRWQGTSVVSTMTGVSILSMYVMFPKTTTESGVLLSILVQTYRPCVCGLVYYFLTHIMLGIFSRTKVYFSMGVETFALLWNLSISNISVAQSEYC